MSKNVKLAPALDVPEVNNAAPAVAGAVPAVAAEAANGKAPKKAPVKKAAPKAAAKKAPAKKAAKPEAKAPAAKKAGLSPNRIKVLKLIAKAKSGSVSRAEVMEALEIESGLTSLLGHVDKAQAEPKSLVGMGLIKASKLEGEPVKYELTAAGKKAIEKNA